jgi:simple sugar transport system permease protein
MLASGVAVDAIGRSFVALIVGSVGSIPAISETLVAATPLIIAGLGIAVGFKAGLFNIGAEGQLMVGGIVGVIVGFAVTGLPMWLHIPLALVVAFFFGGVWGGAAGWLKVTAGAHEVITTIMLNFITFRLVDWMLRNPPLQNPERSDPISRYVGETAILPRLLQGIDPALRVNLGIIIALLAAAVVAWLLWRTKLGFEFRVMGANPEAGRFAGINAGATVVLAMAISGGICAIAGATLTMGVLGRASPGFTGGLGFEAIAVALLARSHPIAVVFAGLLFGALRAGGRFMQVSAGVSLDLITIVQALVVLFIAAPMLIKTIYPFFGKETSR